MGEESWGVIHLSNKKSWCWFFCIYFILFSLLFLLSLIHFKQRFNIPYLFSHHLIFTDFIFILLHFQSNICTNHRSVQQHLSHLSSCLVAALPLLSLMPSHALSSPLLLCPHILSLLSPLLLCPLSPVPCPHIPPLSPWTPRRRGVWCVRCSTPRVAVACSSFGSTATERAKTSASKSSTPFAARWSDTKCTAHTSLVSPKTLHSLASFSSSSSSSPPPPPLSFLSFS